MKGETFLFDPYYEIKKGVIYLKKYDENGFSKEPDYTCDICGYPNDGTEYKETDNGNIFAKNVMKNGWKNIQISEQYETSKS